MRKWKRAKSSGAAVIRSDMEAHEVALLRSLIDSLTALFDERESTVPFDELAELTGITTGHTNPPSDLTLARLLPDFHRPDQDRITAPDAAIADLNGALRSLHEPRIIAAKRDAARVVIETLPTRGAGRVELTHEQAQQWLAALNDIRLALGAMLGIDDHTPDSLPQEDPMAGHLDVYQWLTVMQDFLVMALMDELD